MAIKNSLYTFCHLLFLYVCVSATKALDIGQIRLIKKTTNTKNDNNNQNVLLL